jgi:hypothetical protein
LSVQVRDGNLIKSTFIWIRTHIYIFYPQCCIT